MRSFARDALAAQRQDWLTRAVKEATKHLRNTLDYSVGEPTFDPRTMTITVPVALLNVPQTIAIDLTLSPPLETQAGGHVWRFSGGRVKFGRWAT